MRRKSCDVKLGKVGIEICRVSIIYDENGINLTNLRMKGHVWMQFSSVMTAKDCDVLQAHDVQHVYRRHLSIIYDRIIGTRKGTEQFARLVQTKNNKLICPC